MKKILITITALTIIVAFFYSLLKIETNEEDVAKEKETININFSGNFTQEELEKIMSGKITVEELQEIAGKEDCSN